MLVVDAANVVGSRPNEWWRDRPGAARDLVARVRSAVVGGRLDAPVVVVLEGKARAGADIGAADGVEVVHAPREGDDAIVDVVAARGRDGEHTVTLVSADRGLAARVREHGATVVGPTWLLDRLEGS